MPELEHVQPAYQGKYKRSITQTHNIKIERINSGKPILNPLPENSWESKVVLNPGVVLIQDRFKLSTLMRDWDLVSEQQNMLKDQGGAAVMLYRAQGEANPETGYSPSSIGLAVYTPDLSNLIWRYEKPVLEPNMPFNHLGVEDGRCTQINGTYYFVYTGYYFDKKKRRNCVQICIAKTNNFLDWEHLGPIKGNLNDVDNKNAVLFSSKFDNQWVMLHRPMQGENPKSIHWAVSDSLNGRWLSQGMIMASYRYKEFEESWIGAGGQPIKIQTTGKNKYLIIYHMGHYTKNGEREYDLAAAIIEFKDGNCLVKNRIEPLMRPFGTAEIKGDPELGVDNVIFSCANYRLGDDLIIPYAGADSRIFAAKIHFKNLLRELQADE